MATLSAWKFPTEDGAYRAELTLIQLAKADLVELKDGAVVSWPTGKSKPKTRQMMKLTGPVAMAGGFWGLLIGCLLWAPFLGLAIGAALGGYLGHHTEVGIAQGFIADIRRTITPGSSALFVLTADPVDDAMAARFVGSDAALVTAVLS